jgi:hypothetical protein
MRFPCTVILALSVLVGCHQNDIVPPKQVKYAIVSVDDSLALVLPDAKVVLLYKDLPDIPGSGYARGTMRVSGPGEQMGTGVAWAESSSYSYSDGVGTLRAADSVITFTKEGSLLTAGDKEYEIGGSTWVVLISNAKTFTEVEGDEKDRLIESAERSVKALPREQ